jgi:Beta-propeller repeat
MACISRLVALSFLTLTASLGWSVIFDNTGTTDFFTDTGIDNVGNIYAVGATDSVVNGLDLLVVSYQPGGAQRWVTTMDSPFHGDDIGFSTAYYGSTLDVLYNSDGLNWNLLKACGRDEFDEATGVPTGAKTYHFGTGDISLLGSYVANGGVYMAMQLGSTTYLDGHIRYESGSAYSFFYINDGDTSEVKYTVADATSVYAVGSYTLAGVQSTVIAKYDAAMTAREWKVTLSGAAGDRTPSGIALDSSGNLYVAGTTQELATGKDFFITKFSSSGAVLQDRILASFGNTDEIATGFGLISGSYPIIVGSTNLTGSKDSCGVVLRTNFLTRYTFVDSGTAGGDDEAVSVAIDGAGAYVLCKSQNLGTGYDFRVLRQSATGAVWSVAHALTAGDDIPASIRAHNAGLYIAGSAGSDAALLRISKLNGSLVW